MNPTPFYTSPSRPPTGSLVLGSQRGHRQDLAIAALAVRFIAEEPWCRDR